MLHAGPLAALLATVFAVLPVLVVAVRAFRILRSPRDSTLPARFLAFRSGVGGVGTIGATLIVFLTPAYWWLVPIEVIAVACVWFVARRRLLEETWGLPAYLSHFLRTLLALSGPWIFLALLPSVVRAWPPIERPSGALFVLGAMVAWWYAYRRLLLFLLRARALGRADLEVLFGAIVARSKIVAPAPFALPCRGRWINAFALPGIRHSRVLFTEGLLAHMPADEIAAIFAHEVAHLEHYTPARLRRAGWSALFLSVVGTIAVPALFKRIGDDGWLACLVWALLIVFSLALRASRHKRHESESDRRAAELCGDGEALVRALTRLHTLALMPRQWQDDTWVSHPSLARRIQALRALQAQAVTDRPMPVAVFAASPGVWVVFDTHRVHWLDGVPQGTPAEPAALVAAAPVARSVMYGELTQLRVDVRRKTPLLVARDRAHRSWTVALAERDAAAVQTAVDAVDVRLAAVPERPRWRIGRWVAAAAAVVACGVLALVLLVALASRWERGKTAGAGLPDIVWSGDPIPIAREVTLPGRTYDARVSPSGASYAVAINPVTDDSEEDDESASRHFRIGVRDAAPAECEAWDLAFIDDTHLLRLSIAGSLRLRLDEIDGAGRPVGEWSQDLPWIVAPTLGVQPATRRWTLAGTEYRPSRLVTLSGTVGGTDVQTKRLDLPKGVMPVPRLDAERAALAVRFDYGGAPTPWRMLVAGLFGRLHMRSELLQISPSGSRSLVRIEAMVTCHPPPVGVPDFACASQGGGDSSLWIVDPEAAVVDARARLGAELIDAAVTPRGVVVLTARSAGIVGIGGAPNRRLTLPAGRTALRAVTYDNGVGIIAADAKGDTRLLSYELR